MINNQQVTTGPSRDIDIDELLDDPELERLHADRLASMQKEAEKRAKLQRRGHGELQVSSLHHICRNPDYVMLSTQEHQRPRPCSMRICKEWQQSVIL